MSTKFHFLFISIFTILIFSCSGNPSENTQVDSKISANETEQVKSLENVQQQTPLEFIIKRNQNSTARYIVNEQLVKLPAPNDAMGSTKDIVGKIILSENGQISTDHNSSLEVNMLSLKSDSNRRDDYMKRKSLESNTYPTASFQITKINNLTYPIPENQKLDFELIGTLTIREISKEVSWDVSGKFDGTKLTGLAKTEFKFGFFEIEIPKVFVVVSVKDLIQLEIEFEAIKVD